MAWNNYALSPVGFQQPQMTQAYQIPQPQQNGINWVQGLAGAKAFMVAPGQTAFLMDSEGQTLAWPKR